MDCSSAEPSLLEVIASLCKITNADREPSETAKTICSFCRDVFGAQLCVIVTLNNARISRVVSSTASGPAPDTPLLFGASGTQHLDETLFREGRFVERYDLKVNGQGVASRASAHRHNFTSMMAAPIRLDGSLSGYLATFHNTNESFSSSSKGLLSIFADHVGIVLKDELHRKAERSFPILNEMTRGLASSSAAAFLRMTAKGVCDLLGTETCVVWEYDENRRLLRIVACTDDVSPSYRALTLSADDPQVRNKLIEGSVVHIQDVSAESAEYAGKNHARAHGWVSLLTVPMHVEGRLAGLLDVYTPYLRSFHPWEKQAFQVFVNEAALSLHHLQWRVQELDNILREIGGAPTKAVLFEGTLRNAMKLVDVDRGWIGILDVQTGKINVVAERGSPQRTGDFAIGKGIAGIALAEERALRVDDIGERYEYEACWEDTRSELAIPLIIDRAEVRIGRTTGFGTRRIGVLNLESTAPGAFFHLDETRLTTLARACASAFDRLDTDLKFAKLSRIETEMLQKGMTFQQTVDRILLAINDTLGFSFVNLSLVDFDAGRIKTEYIAGLSPDQAARFKKMADHPLDGEQLDIQADVVKSREIEVPDKNDPRFDHHIFKHFDHQDLIRVYIPMVSPSGSRVVGTVEAGYPRAFQPYIYERDVRVLDDFVLFVTEALEQRREEVLETIMHEFRAPAAAIRSNVSFVGRHLPTLKPQILQRKLDDLALDAELVLLQVAKVERFLGGTAPESTPQRTLVYRDIIIKTVNQLKPQIQSAGFDPFKVHYDVRDVGRIVLFIDPAKLNQVVFNLLINAIKYAERDPKLFAITIDMIETSTHFIVKFQDMGIGIQKEHKDRVFEQGFRAPEARGSFVTGSGFGLTIARNIMRELGGDLQLTNNSKPTEFSVLLPKSLKDSPR